MAFPFELVKMPYELTSRETGRKQEKQENELCDLNKWILKLAFIGDLE